MKKRIVTLGVCAVLSILPFGAFADRYDRDDAVLGGIVGGVIGGILGATATRYPVYAAPAPVVVETYSRPVVVESYRRPVVVERYGPPVVVRKGHAHYRHHHHKHGRGRHKSHRGRY
jgi:hypothetical protein